MFGQDSKRRDKKTPLSDAQKQAIADWLAKMLAAQMGLVPPSDVEVTEVEARRGEINGKALGYLYGFVDAALQSMGQDIADVPVGVPVLYHVLRQLFPGHESGYMEFFASHDRDNPVTLGMMEGGQQFIDYIANPRPPGYPMGFARSISEGRHIRETAKSDEI
jgi:hypothetical protein